MSRFGLFLTEIVPFAGALGALAVAAVLVDALLHLLGIVWIGRYLGILGTMSILGSFGYSARKHRWITSGRPLLLLRMHEWMSWAGSLLVLVHAGIHFNSVLAWLAVTGMVINVASGLVGKFLLRRSRQHMDAARASLRDAGVTTSEAHDRMFWDIVAFDAIKQWRVVHFPIAASFGTLAFAHILASVVFWSWA